jgi:O-antigen/teichoic acid export membrane protein
MLILLLPRFGLIGAAIATALAITIEQGAYVMVTARHFHVGLGQLLRHTWRSLLATAAMTIVLVVLGLGWSTPPPGESAARMFLSGVAVGAAVYGCTLVAAWLAAGRPDGPEEDLLRLVRRVGDAVARRRVPRRRATEA